MNGMPLISVPADGTPLISVLMATHDGQAFIADSIDSILSQTHRDLELIVGDDCSSDATAEILRGYDDPRLVVVRNDRNLGVVPTRNRCFALARGRYVALLDHDDISRPHRLERQLDHLVRHPQTVLVGTASEVLERGALRPTSHPDRTTPGLVEWMLQIANPLVCSSVMLRREAALALPEFMRDGYRYADDYDLYHRMSALGRIARLDEKLTIYRLHAANSSRRHDAVMEANAVRVLQPAYASLFGDSAGERAGLVVRHLSAGKPVEDERALRLLADTLDALNRHHGLRLTQDETAAMQRHADRLWRRMLRASADHGAIDRARLLACVPSGFRLSAQDRLWTARPSALLRRQARGAIARGTAARDALDARVGPVAAGRAAQDGTLWSMTCHPVPIEPHSLPSLYVVVDTEAEFDWAQPFGRELNQVRAMDSIERGQDVFDRFAIRPIYVVDHPVSSQPAGYARLRAILQRGGCEIGVHLHPWTTPPFVEPVSNRNSFPGNLDPAVEASKIDSLIATIEATFGRRPRFYRAGRYGFGPSTAATLARLAIDVDLSVLPGADLRPIGGPDFRAMEPVPYRIGTTGLLTVPMTRRTIGAWPSVPGHAARPLRPLLSRLRISDTITLTPEGVTAAEQKRLIRASIRRGQRLFVLHFHSPSLGSGHTPYAPDEAGARELRVRLSEVCRFFIDELGGVPGHPDTLVRMARRARASAGSGASPAT